MITNNTTQTISLAIKATPAEIWQALVDPSLTPAYYVGFSAEFELTPGADYRYTAGDVTVIDGTVVDVEPEHRLATTFNGRWDPAVAELDESTVTFTLDAPAMPLPGITILTCRHEGLPDTPVAAGLESGWATILSGLKTLLETGAPMVAPPS